MVRTLSAGSTTESDYDHEIKAHRAHNAPSNACRGRPRPRPPQDQAAYRGRGSDTNRIDWDSQSRCSGTCKPGARLAPAPAFVEDAAPTRTASIAAANPDAPAPVSPPPVTAPAPAMPEPPQRMTASQEASLDAWMIKTYLACWKPAAQPADTNPYVARVRLKIQTRRIAPEAAEARQSAVRSGAEATGKERVAGCQGMRPFTDAP